MTDSSKPKPSQNNKGKACPGRKVSLKADFYVDNPDARFS